MHTQNLGCPILCEAVYKEQRGREKSCQYCLVAAADQLRMQQGASGPNPAASVSFHMIGDAVDLNHNYPANTNAWDTIRDAFTGSGLTWGGNFNTIDPVHFQLEPAGTSPTAVEVQNCETVGVLLSCCYSDARLGSCEQRCGGAGKAEAEVSAMRHLFGMFVPGGVLLLAAWAVQQEEVVRGMAAPYAVYFCFSALIVPVLLSWYHDQSRLLAISLALAFTVFGWVRLPAEANTARLAMMFFLPLIFLLTEVFSEQRVLTRIGCLRIGLVVCAALGVAWMSGAKDGWWTALFAWGGGRSTWTWLPWTEQLSFAVGALLILFFAIRRRSKTEQAMLWALLAAFLGAHARKPEAMYFYYGTAGLVVMFAVMEHSAEITDRDELTGLPGRRALNRALEQLGRRYALAMCDVDHFKRFNDTYGHETGDQVLRMVASRLSRVSGDSEVFRFGGEEFVIAFRGLSAEEAEPLADSVRKAIADAGFSIRGSNRPAERPVQGPLPASDQKTSVTITISIGLAEATSKDSSPEAVLRAADQALYQAKEAGRNCLWVAASASGASTSATGP